MSNTSFTMEKNVMTTGSHVPLSTLARLFQTGELSAALSDDKKDHESDADNGMNLKRLVFKFTPWDESSKSITIPYSIPSIKSLIMSALKHFLLYSAGKKVLSNFLDLIGMKPKNENAVWFQLVTVGGVTYLILYMSDIFHYDDWDNNFFNFLSHSLNTIPYLDAVRLGSDILEKDMMPLLANASSFLEKGVYTISVNTIDSMLSSTFNGEIHTHVESIIDAANVTLAQKDHLQSILKDVDEMFPSPVRVVNTIEDKDPQGVLLIQNGDEGVYLDTRKTFSATTWENIWRYQIEYNDVNGPSGYDDSETVSLAHDVASLPIAGNVVELNDKIKANLTTELESWIYKVEYIDEKVDKLLTALSTVETYVDFSTASTAILMSWGNVFTPGGNKGAKAAVAVATTLYQSTTIALQATVLIRRGYTYYAEQMGKEDTTMDINLLKNIANRIFEWLFSDHETYAPKYLRDAFIDAYVDLYEYESLRGNSKFSSRRELLNIIMLTLNNIFKTQTGYKGWTAKQVVDGWFVAFLSYALNNNSISIKQISGVNKALWISNTMLLTLNYAKKLFGTRTYPRRLIQLANQKFENKTATTVVRFLYGVVAYDPFFPLKLTSVSKSSKAGFIIGNAVQNLKISTFDENIMNMDLAKKINLSEKNYQRLLMDIVDNDSLKPRHVQKELDIVRPYKMFLDLPTYVTQNNEIMASRDIVPLIFKTRNQNKKLNETFKGLDETTFVLCSILCEDGTVYFKHFDDREYVWYCSKVDKDGKEVMTQFKWPTLGFNIKSYNATHVIYISNSLYNNPKIMFEHAVRNIEGLASIKEKKIVPFSDDKRHPLVHRFCPITAYVFAQPKNADKTVKELQEEIRALKKGILHLDLKLSDAKKEDLDKLNYDDDYAGLLQKRNYKEIYQDICMLKNCKIMLLSYKKTEEISYSMKKTTSTVYIGYIPAFIPFWYTDHFIACVSVTGKYQGLKPQSVELAFVKDIKASQPYFTQLYNYFTSTKAGPDDIKDTVLYDSE